MLNIFEDALEAGMQNPKPKPAYSPSPILDQSAYERSRAESARKEAEPSQLVQSFLDSAKNDGALAKKREAVIQMIQNGEDKAFIEDAIANKMQWAPTVAEVPKEEIKSTSSISNLIGGIGVEAPAFVGRTLAGASRLGSYINPMTYFSETQKARGEAGAQMVQAEGERQSKAQEEVLRSVGVDTTSTAGEIGKGITKYGIPAVVPIGGGTMATTIGGLAKQGAKYGAIGGAIQSVTDQGAGLTPEELAKQTAIGAGAGAVINPSVGKLLVPAITKIAEK